jgi:hypothetical protein
MAECCSISSPPAATAGAFRCRPMSSTGPGALKEDTAAAFGLQRFVIAVHADRQQITADGDLIAIRLGFTA